MSMRTREGKHMNQTLQNEKKQRENCRKFSFTAGTTTRISGWTGRIS